MGVEWECPPNYYTEQKPNPPRLKKELPQKLIGSSAKYSGEKPKRITLANCVSHETTYRGLQPAQWVSCGIKAFPLGEAGFRTGKAKDIGQPNLLGPSHS